MSEKYLDYREMDSPEESHIVDSCPTCVQGAVITDELVEAEAQLLYAVLGEVRSRPLTPTNETVYHIAARAVLADAVRRLQTEERI